MSTPVHTHALYVTCVCPCVYVWCTYVCTCVVYVCVCVGMYGVRTCVVYVYVPVRVVCVYVYICVSVRGGGTCMVGGVWICGVRTWCVHVCVYVYVYMCVGYTYTTLDVSGRGRHSTPLTPSPSRPLDRSRDSVNTPLDQFGVNHDREGPGAPVSVPMCPGPNLTLLYACRSGNPRSRRTLPVPTVPV